MRARRSSLTTLLRMTGELFYGYTDIRIYGCADVRITDLYGVIRLLQMLRSYGRACTDEIECSSVWFLYYSMIFGHKTVVFR